MSDNPQPLTPSAPQAALEEVALEATLRPRRFEEFVGQQALKDNLRVFIEAAKQRKEPLDHVLLFGPPGLGKTTLAHIMAHEMNANVKTTSGPVLDKPADLAGLLTNLEEGDVLFIDEIHRLNHVVEEYLYPAMEDFYLDIMIDKGPNARSVKLNLPRFTLIGATTRSGLLTSPLRDRFGVASRLEFYAPEELSQIITRSSQILQIQVDPQGALEIARRSRGTPRIANRLLRRVRDFAQIHHDNVITQPVAHQALTRMEVDVQGLDQMDKRILTVIMNDYSGGPVGIGTLAISVGEAAETLEEIYEPYLIQAGFLKRTSQGRMTTERAYRHFGLTPPVRSNPQAQKEIPL